MPLPFVQKVARVAASSPLPTTPAPATVVEAFDPRTLKGQAVGDSDDLRRVLALPRRERPSDTELLRIAADLKARYGKGNVACECLTKFRRPCCANLMPVQAWALHEAETVGGLLGPIGVGHGKTMLDMLVSMVAGSKTAVLLLPPNLKKQFLEVDWHYYGQHWHLPNLAGGKFYVPGRPFLHVVAFSELSGAKSTELLDKLKPDTLIVDEAHSVRNRTASRTKRFLRYFKSHPDTKLFCWSGTLTSRSLKDYAHLAAFSLRQGAPVPLHWPQVEAWAAALDPADIPTPPGKLLQLGGRDVREGFQQRLVGTRGVVSSGDTASCQASLLINERRVEVPRVVQEHLDALEKTWARPDGDELVDALSKARCARELSCGFYYRWRWPRGEPIPVIEAWLEARKEWHKELREKLKTGKAHMDSPLLLTRAAIRWYDGYTYIHREPKRVKNPLYGVEEDEPRYVEEAVETGREFIPPQTRNGPLPTWASEHWLRWKEVRDTARPETEAVWLDDWLVRDAAAWLAEGPGICWYEFDAFGSAVFRAAAGATYAGPGKDGDSAVIGLRGDERVVASIRAHGTGKNLQQFARNLVSNPPSDGATWEQLLGRTHRAGQLADEVTYDVYRHTDAFKSAVDRARDLSDYIEQTFGATQRLASVASWGF